MITMEIKCRLFILGETGMHKDGHVFIALVIAAVLLGYVIGSSNNKDYVAELEKTLAKCVDKKYHPIKIGDDVFLCGINQL